MVNHIIATISILCHNHLEVTKKCIDSVLKNSPENIEVLITDNASTDETPSYLTKIKDKRVKIITNLDNVGFIKAHNYNVEIAIGKYFIALNNDLTVPQHYLQLLLEEFNNPEVMLVGGAGGNLNNQGIGNKSKEKDCDYIEGSCLCILSSFARNIELFKKDFTFGYCEDSDLSLRVRAMGYKIKNINLNLNHLQAITTKELTNIDIKGIHLKNHYILKQKWYNYLVKDTLKESILIKRKGSIGDVFLLTPIIEELKRENVYNLISVVTACPQFLNNNPNLQNIFYIRSNYNKNWEYTFDRIYDLDLAYEKRPLINIIDAYADKVGITLTTRIPRLYLEDKFKIKKSFKYIVVHLEPSSWVGRYITISKMNKIINKLKDKGYKIVEIGQKQRLSSDIFITGIRKSAGWIRSADGFIGADSCFAHIAQAYIKPTVIFFGSINPKTRIVANSNIIRSVTSNLGCLYCHQWQSYPRVDEKICLRGNQECMNKITSEQVIKEFEKAKEEHMKSLETSKIRNQVFPYCLGKGIDLGCKDDKIKPSALGVDKYDYDGVDKILDVSKKLPFESNSFDYVYSSHCLEDIYNTKETLREWIRILKIKGNIILYLPHKDLYEGYNEDHKHTFINQDITTLLKTLNCNIILDIIDKKLNHYSMLIIGVKNG